MASHRRSSKLGKKNVLGVVVAVAVAGILLGDWVEARHDVRRQSPTCSTAEKYVYPEASSCDSPATLDTAYHYLAFTFGTSEEGLDESGELEPEWDDSNSAFYVRFADSSSTSGGTPYAALQLFDDLHLHTTNADTLLTNSTVVIYNVESRRSLQWRQEGEEGYFLTEQQELSPEEGALFRFVKAEDVIVPCPSSSPPLQCNAYHLLSDPSPSAGSAFPTAGLLAYKEHGAIYIKSAPQGSVGDVYLLVNEPSTSLQRAGTTIFPLSAIRTATN